MKTIAYLITLALVTSVACQSNKPKDYVTFSGKIINPNSDSLTILNRSKTFSKTLKVEKDGTFKDTLRVPLNQVNYVAFDGKEMAYLYLKNGYDIQVTLNAKAFDETIKFKGVGAQTNNYLAERALIREKKPVLFTLDKEVFYFKTDSITKSDIAFLENYAGLDLAFVNKEKAKFKKWEEQSIQYFNRSDTLTYKGYLITKNKNIPKRLTKGKSSPKFSGYTNFKGGTTSLSDLKGKYVYIDVWATWCGPCKKEIPSLKKIEEEYHGKNISFVSISIDRKKDYGAWRKMVADKALGGVQLFADKSFKSDFIGKYGITGIPRFILLDPSGNIVDADAPRPSSKKVIRGLLSSLNIQ